MALVKLEEPAAMAIKTEPTDCKPPTASSSTPELLMKVEIDEGMLKDEQNEDEAMPPPQSLFDDGVAAMKDDEEQHSVIPPVPVESDIMGSPLSPSPSDTHPQSRSKSTSKTTSRSTTPPPASASRGSKRKVALPVQLIADLPIARDDALDTFTEIQANTYQNKSLGRSREALEGMSCECAYSQAYTLGTPTCGNHDNCINRLTQIECLADCRGGDHCQNQRFQRKQYSSIDIVKTEKKGFGLRAEEEIAKDGFIYEYVGEVVNPNQFKKRMRDYAEEGIEHFYFMMLQKDEFIDATKCGGIGRFANHSCNPNCYVAKWTVGDFVRMGIFAKRKIQKNEELTFNYNVDRYGFKAQECYCGEPNCVGFLGGKTQTDIAAVDDLYLDALGITDEDELIELKGTKKKKGKKIDDDDFMPTLTPILTPQLPKIINALRQTSSRALIHKLLDRFSLTTEESTLREMLRLRCMTLMKQLLDDHFPKNLDIISQILKVLLPWPLTTRNKIDMCCINTSVQKIADETEDVALRESATNLIAHWNTLPTAYRIRKRTFTGEVKMDDFEAISSQKEEVQLEDSSRDDYAPRATSSYRSFVKDRRHHYRYTNIVPPLPRAPNYEDDDLPSPQKPVYVEASKADVDAVIKAAIAQKAADDAAAAAAAEADKAKSERKISKEGKTKEKRKQRSSSSKKAAQTPEEREANRNKRLLKLVGAVVVKSMSKYGKGLEREKFKKYAKELTQLIADKEKKSSSYRDNKLEALSDEKVAKIKKFSKDYIAKVMRKMDKDKAGRKGRPSSSTPLPTSSTFDTPNSAEAENGDGDVDMPEMTVEEAMDMDPASDSEGEEEESDEENAVMDVEESTRDVEMADAESSQKTLALPPADISPERTLPPTDPRRRPPDEGDRDTWDRPSPPLQPNVSIVA
ncbi:Histone methyltransferase [Mycena indigotica]|uniref:[histone H3]-lysine(36) N-trimethyltransferase n=1 Tax=Mycena indigotica TaxID=2126181 RepID=A0A8H6W2T1_9AGAR|nr:Histone methyltransferase [Mycena indigotica]KAF7297264.1 Histone methyltransferase [Mycena indigotica]